MKSINAFIDESGNTDLDTSKAGASNYFVIAAITVHSDKTSQLRAAVEQLRLKHFQRSEIKSSSISNKDGHKRRIRILNDILCLDFKFHAIAVDKKAIARDSGLRFKKTFLKFLNGKLYRRLFHTAPDINVFADEHGSIEFQNSFKKYIETNHKPDLFFQSTFTSMSSESDVLIQLADLVVGTIAKVYEDKHSPALLEAYLELIDSKALEITEWPIQHSIYRSDDTASTEFDRLIAQHSLQMAEKFIETNESADDEVIMMQVSILRHLIFKSRWQPDAGHQLSTKLMKHLRENGFNDVTEHTFRTSVIAKLRDNEVIIATSNRGYKVPACEADLSDYVDRVNSTVQPYLRRLEAARQSFLLASNGDFDLLRGPQYPTLVRLLDAVKETE